MYERYVQGACKQSNKQIASLLLHAINSGGGKGGGKGGCMQSIHVVVGGISPTTASVAEVAMETANYTKDRSGYTSRPSGASFSIRRPLTTFYTLVCLTRTTCHFHCPRVKTATAAANLPSTQRGR